MKHLKLLTLILALCLLSAGTLYAKYQKGYKVVAKHDDQLVIEDKQGHQATVTTKQSADFSLDEKILYNAKRNKIRKMLDGC